MNAEQPSHRDGIELCKGTLSVLGERARKQHNNKARQDCRNKLCILWNKASDFKEMRCHVLVLYSCGKDKVLVSYSLQKADCRTS